MLNHKLRTCQWFYRAIRKSIREKKNLPKMLHFFAYRSLAKNANFREKNKCKNMRKYKFWCWALTVKNSSSFLLLLQHLWFSWNFYLSDVSRKSLRNTTKNLLFFFRKSFCALETLVMIGHPNNIFKVVKTLRDFIFKD